MHYYYNFNHHYNHPYNNNNYLLITLTETEILGRREILVATTYFGNLFKFLTLVQAPCLKVVFFPYIIHCPAVHRTQEDRREANALYSSAPPLNCGPVQSQIHSGNAFCRLIL